ncbi:WD40 repeat-like protein [Bimuria novae-zelandiae CBS 107.79]|uniref:WD40 repeat-like protein n=1 Tax=Bimuria novae-zelandiae CBS 107.79 TaxID=1447943 RepID=A0A6A5V2S0_9PLEO|nr:WD40 repeat-like protein [Bimuria novae-zelandiae CBS 107.79]
MEDVDDGDADGDGDADADGDEGDEDGDDGDGDGDDDDGNGDNDDDDQDEPDSPSQRPRSLPNGTSTIPGASRTDTNPTVTLTSPSPRAASIAGGLPFRPSVRQEALNAPVYDIIPTIAAPHSTSINAVTATPDMRWVFSGGADGYIRKFNWIDTANGKLALTVAQRHPFVDSVTKAGVLLSYWENEDSDRNEDATSLSPVYSLAVHHQSLWLLSGLESGGINLQSVRHEEGKRIHTLHQHTSAVSVLTLAQDETSVLSGSWDKTINDWDLNTGQVKRRFETSGGQISAIEQRPMSTVPIPQDTNIVPVSNGTFSSNNASRPQANGLSNGVGPSSRPSAREENGNEDAAGSPEDSLFGDKDSLFGDDKDPSNGPSAFAAYADDEDDELSRAIANGIQQADEDANAGMDMMDLGGPVQAPAREQSPEALKKPPAAAAGDNTETMVNGVSESQSSAHLNGLPHSEEISGAAASGALQAEQPASSETTFFDAAIDGPIRIWDRRQSKPIARIAPPRNTPPWCMNACWSPDGNFIYAGRRNGTVDEYSLHKSLREPRRTFKFPGVSGAVSAVRAMPNRRHLVCASYDILRLYDLHEQENKNLAVPFLIVPGHRTGVISQLYLDPTCNFMISTGGNRGWEGSTTEVLLGYEIGIPS